MIGSSDRGHLRLERVTKARVCVLVRTLEPMLAFERMQQVEISHGHYAGILTIKVAAA